MATFQITAPDGQTYEITAPEGATEQDVLAFAQQQFAQQQQEPQQPQQRSMGQEAMRQLGLTGRALYETFTAPATAVLEAGRSAYNLAAPESAQMPSFYAEQARNLSALGVPAPENLTERAVQAGTQSLAGAAGLARAAPSIPAFASELSRQLPAAAVAGLTSQPAAELTAEFTGSDIAGVLAGIGVGALTASGTAKAIAAVESGKVPLYTIEQIKQRATQSYRKMDEAGIAIKPISAKGLVTKIRQSLDDARMVEGTDQARELNNRLAQIDDMIGTTRVDFNKLEKIRGIINDLRLSRDPDLRRLGNIALGEVDSYITTLSGKDLIAGKNNLGSAVKEVVSARKDWRNASRATVLEDALNVAEAKALDPRASESELIRRGFINIAADKNKMKMFNKQEQNIIKSVAKGGSLDTLLTFAAQFSPLRSKLAAVGTGVAYTQSPVVAGTVAGGGLAADLAQSALRRRTAEQAIRQIASGAARPTVSNAGSLGLLSGIVGPYDEEDRNAGVVAP
jgi:hypothetical protein